jgi:hypothetical protein
MIREAFVYDPDDAMPRAIQERNHALNVQARHFYSLRDQARDLHGLPLVAQTFQRKGDARLTAAMALTGEWSV